MMKACPTLTCAYVAVSCQLLWLCFIGFASLLFKYLFSIAGILKKNEPRPAIENQVVHVRSVANRLFKLSHPCLKIQPFEEYLRLIK
jgi:hypothetical protein